jgi:hypothetical protein
MKIIHSFWSKPYLGSNTFNHNRSVGGWMHKNYFFMSCTLSCLRFLDIYGRIDLVTDKKGKRLFIDILGLPYTNVSTDLDALEEYDESLWALGKIYTYGMQNEAFLHVDNDIFIWSTFPQKIEKAPLIAQNIESNHEYYRDLMDFVYREFTYKPDFLIPHESNDIPKAYNAGIMGGNDFAFFKIYTKEVFNFINKNKVILKETRKGGINCIFEQLFFYILANNNNIPVECLLPEMDEYLIGLANFHLVPQKATYIHTVASYKTNNVICRLLARRLHYEFPEYYYRIEQLVKDNMI